MRKKPIFIALAIFTLIAFGTVSSAHAIVEPISLAVVLGACFFTLVTATEQIKHTTTDTAQKQKITKVNRTKEGSIPESGLVMQTTVNLSN